MKKILSLVLVTVLSVATLAGCGSADTMKLVDTLSKTLTYEGVTGTGTVELQIDKEEFKKHLVVAAKESLSLGDVNDAINVEDLQPADVKYTVNIDEEINEIMSRVPEKVSVDYSINWPNYEKAEFDFEFKCNYDGQNLEFAGYLKPDHLAIELDTLKSVIDAMKASESELLEELTVSASSVEKAIVSLKEEGYKYIRFEDEFVDPQEFSDMIRQIKAGELEKQIKDAIAKIKDADASEIISSKNGVINLHGNGCSLAKLYSNIAKAIKDSEIVDEVIKEEYTIVDGTYVDRTNEDILIETSNGQLQMTVGDAVLRGDVEGLTAGDRVIAIVSSAYTMSLPPITNAQLIYAGDDMLLADFVVNEKVQVDAKYKVTSDDNKYVMYIDNYTPVSDRRNKMIMKSKDIKAGDRLFVLYDNATKSIPSQLSVKEIIRVNELQNAYVIDEPCYTDTANCIERDFYDELQATLQILIDADEKKMVSDLDMEKEVAKICADALKNSVFDINVKEDNNAVVTEGEIRININNVDLFKIKAKETVKECDPSYTINDCTDYNLIESEIFEARCAKFLAREEKLETLNIYWNTMIPVFGEHGTFVRNPGPDESFDCRIETTHAGGRECVYYGKAFLREDRIYLPMRQIVECSGLDVEWDGKTAYAVMADGTKAELAGFIENGRTYVKVRDFEKVGVKVDYVGGSNLDGVESENKATLEFN